MKNPGKIKIFVYIALLAALAAAVLGVFQGSSQPAPEVASAANSTPIALSVRTATATSTEEPVEVLATGSFAAETAADVAPDVAGKVASTYVDVGSFVHQGDPLIKLDDRDAQLRLEQATASLAQANAALRQAQSKMGLDKDGATNPEQVPEVLAAKSALDSAASEAQQAKTDASRQEQLLGLGVISRSAYEQARTKALVAAAQEQAAREQYQSALNAARQGFSGIDAAQAAVQAAQVQLQLARKAVNDSVVRAPFDGYVADRKVSKGEFVSNSSTVARLVRIDPLKLQLELPEKESGIVRSGLGVTAAVASYPGQEFSGKVRAVSPAVDPNSRTLMVECIFPNPEGKLRPGMFANAGIQLAQLRKIVYVPEAAVIQDPNTGAYSVYLIHSGSAQLKVVQIGDEKGGRIQILNGGVRGGDHVAIANLGKLYDGAKVRDHA